MPIIVFHQGNTLQQLGDMATNAGQFAAGMEQSADGRSWQQLQNQYAIAQQQHGLEQQHLDQQYALQRHQQDLVDQWHAFQAGQQRQQLASRNANFQSGLDHQYAKDQGNWDQQAANRQSHEGIAQDRNDLGYYRSDAQTDLGYHKADQLDTYHKGLLDVAHQRLGAYEQSIANRAANGNQAASLQLRQQIEQRVAGNQDLQQQRAYLITLMAQEQHLVHASDPYGPAGASLTPEQQQQVQQQLDANRAEQRRVGAIYEQKIKGVTVAPPVAPPGAPQPAAVPPGSVSAAPPNPAGNASLSGLFAHGQNDLGYPTPAAPSVGSNGWPGQNLMPPQAPLSAYYPSTPRGQTFMDPSNQAAFNQISAQASHNFYYPQQPAASASVDLSGVHPDVVSYIGRRKAEGAAPDQIKGELLQMYGEQ